MADLLPALLAEHQPQTTLERRLTEQLANVLRKQTQAEDNETFLLANPPQYLLTHAPDTRLVPDPAYLIYNNRLDASRVPRPASAASSPVSCVSCTGSKEPRSR